MSTLLYQEKAQGIDVKIERDTQTGGVVVTHSQDHNSTLKLNEQVKEANRLHAKRVSGGKTIEQGTIAKIDALWLRTTLRLIGLDYPYHPSQGIDYQDWIKTINRVVNANPRWKTVDETL
jgi:hypothetical protein